MGCCLLEDFPVCLLVAASALECVLQNPKLFLWSFGARDSNPEVLLSLDREAQQLSDSKRNLCKPMLDQRLHIHQVIAEL